MLPVTTCGHVNHCSHGNTEGVVDHQQTYGQQEAGSDPSFHEGEGCGVNLQTYAGQPHVKECHHRTKDVMNVLPS